MICELHTSLVIDGIVTQRHSHSAIPGNVFICLWALVIAQAVDKGITGNEVWVTLGSRRNGNRLALAAIRQLRPIACSGYNSVFNRQPFRYG